MNIFNALRSSDEDSNDSESEIIESSKEHRHSDEVVVEVEDRQYGGTIPIRYDPKVGMLSQQVQDGDETLLGFSNSDLTTCLKVIRKLGNMKI